MKQFGSKSNPIGKKWTLATVFISLFLFLSVQAFAGSIVVVGLTNITPSFTNNITGYGTANYLSYWYNQTQLRPTTFTLSDLSSLNSSAYSTNITAGNAWVRVISTNATATTNYQNIAGIAQNLSDIQTNLYLTKANQTTVASVITNLTSTNNTVHYLFLNSARIDDCPSGYVVQNTTTSGVECVSLTSSIPNYYTNITLLNQSLNYLNLTVLALNQSNASVYVLIASLNTTLTSTNNTASYLYNNAARTGNCPAGQVVGNTTINGVECLTVSSSGDNASWNESYANTLYYPLNSNPNNYINTTQDLTDIYRNISLLNTSKANASYTLTVSGAPIFLNSGSSVNLYGSGVTITMSQASNTTGGFLTAVDWSVFNSANATAGYTYNFLSSIFTNISNAQSSILNLYATKTNTTDFQSLNANQTATNLTLQTLNATTSNIYTQLQSTNATASTRAGTGTCPAGQVVGNTTISGVECLTISSSSSDYDTWYGLGKLYTLESKSNTTLPENGINTTILTCPQNKYCMLSAYFFRNLDLTNTSTYDFYILLSDGFNYTLLSSLSTASNSVSMQKTMGFILNGGESLFIRQSGVAYTNTSVTISYLQYDNSTSTIKTYYKRLSNGNNLLFNASNESRNYYLISSSTLDLTATSLVGLSQNAPSGSSNMRVFQMPPNVVDFSFTNAYSTNLVGFGTRTNAIVYPYMQFNQSIWINATTSNINMFAWINVIEDNK